MRYEQASWSGHRVWLYPPFENVALWVRRVVGEMKDGCPLVVGLLPAWTSSSWWHQYIERGRKSGSIKLRFVSGRMLGQPAQVIVVWQRPGYVVPDARQLDLLPLM